MKRSLSGVPPYVAPTPRQRGVGLIEVLVALLVLSVGFLVSANLQLRGMRANQDTYHYSQALMLANEMMDRMRNNRDGVLAGNYDAMETADIDPPACASTGCDEAGIAQLDRYQWSTSLHNMRDADDFIPALPSAASSAAKGVISGPDADGMYTVTMSWAVQTDDGEEIESLPVRFFP